MHRTLRLTASAAAALLLLSGCAAPEPAPSERQYAARQLAAVGLTVEDFGAGWTLVPADGPSGGPVSEEWDVGDPCEWMSGWVPDFADFTTYSERIHTTGDGGTFVSDWIAAAKSGVDLQEVLAEFEESISACGTTESSDPEKPGTITIIPEKASGFGDASFSYRAEFTGPDGSDWGEGEVHTIICGPLWLNLSYVGWDPFVERDALLPTFVERASELGEC